jgi:hypothetical protein
LMAKTVLPEPPVVANIVLGIEALPGFGLTV